MRIFYFLFSIFLLQSNFALAQYDSIYIDAQHRTYLLHLPTNYSPTTNHALVIAMHGGFGSAFNIAEQSQLSAKADESNFIVVYPEGVRGGLLNIRTWNAGWCCGWSSATEVDDVGFIDALLDSLIQDYAIDTDRIYATGMSNGGFMSYRLACELSDRIAAIAPVACSISMPTCNAARPVPVIQFHSYLDENVPYAGGIGNGTSNHYNPPHDSLLNAWSSLNDCNTLGEVIVDNDDYDFHKWSDCECAAEIHYYITHDGGHSWPGGQATPFGDPVSTQLNATDLLWSFFDTHSLACATTSVETNVFTSLELKLAPNPSRGFFQVELPASITDYEVIIQDQLGKVIYRTKNQNQIDLSTATPGLYFFSLQTKTQRFSKKIIICD